jgi:hypothetical protein
MIAGVSADIRTYALRSKSKASQLYQPDRFCNCNNFFIIIKARRRKLARHVARIGEKRNAYRLLVGKPEGKRPLGRPRRRWLDNIRIVEVGWGDVNWIGLAQDRDTWRALVNSVLDLRVP